MEGGKESDGLPFSNQDRDAPGSQPLPPSHEPNSLAMPSGALGGMSVDQYQQDMTAMPPAKETESLTEFLPGFGVFLFRKDKHSRKRRRQFIKLGRSQKAKVVKVTYSVIEAVCRAMLPDCHMDLLDAVIAEHRGGRREELALGARQHQRAANGMHDGPGEMDEEEDEEDGMTVEEEEGEERDSLGAPRPLSKPRTESDSSLSARSPAMQGGRGEGDLRERKLGEGRGAYGSAHDGEFGESYHKIPASYPYCMQRPVPPHTYPWCVPPDEERACGDEREQANGLGLPTQPPLPTNPSTASQGMRWPSPLESELQWVREGERGPRMSSEASQLEEYVRWSRASNAHQSAAYGGRPSIEDAALHLTAAGLRGLGNMQAGAQFNHLPIGRPLQLLDSGIGGKMDQASMAAYPHLGEQGGNGVALGSFLTLIKAAADEGGQHDRHAHFNRERSESAVGPAHRQGMGPYRTPPLPSRHPGLHGAGSIGSDPCDLAPSGNGTLLQHSHGHWAEESMASLGMAYRRTLPPPQPQQQPQQQQQGHKRSFSGSEGPGDAAQSLHTLRGLMRAAAERTEGGNGLHAMLR